MANGKSGDHPFTDIINLKLDVYSPEAASLVREIADLVGDKDREALANLLNSEFNPYLNPDVERLEQNLTEMRDNALNEARKRGYEL